MIHATAIIDPSAKLGENVRVGPYSIIGANVEIGEGTVIESHVVINGPTRIGRDNHIFQFCSLGEIPQDKKFKGESSRLEIGDRNIIREFCTFNRGTDNGGGFTRLGDDNHIMAYVHIAHDCIVGNHTIFSNNASLAGHVEIDDFVTLGGFSGVFQFCKMGAHSFASMGSMINKDVPPFVKVSGYYASPYGLNVVGLQRRGFSDEVVATLKRAYKTIYRQELTIAQAHDALHELAKTCHEVGLLIEFIQHSERGIIR